MGRKATLAGIRNQLFLPAVWLVVTLLLLVIFQSVGVPGALGDDGESTGVATASDYPLVGADPSEEAMSSVLHAGVMWSLSAVRITPTDDLLGRAEIEVDVTLTNTLATTSLRVSDRLVSLKKVDGALERAVRLIDDGAVPEVVAVELNEALLALGVITGETTPDDVLRRIFERFCVGK